VPAVSDSDNGVVVQQCRREHKRLVLCVGGVRGSRLLTGRRLDSSGPAIESVTCPCWCH
jgi:hypothetical protein